MPSTWLTQLRFSAKLPRSWYSPPELGSTCSCFGGKKKLILLNLHVLAAAHILGVIFSSSVSILYDTAKLIYEFDMDWTVGMLAHGQPFPAFWDKTYSETFREYIYSFMLLGTNFCTEIFISEHTLLIQNWPNLIKYLLQISLHIKSNLVLIQNK